MTNLSQQKRERMLAFLNKIKAEHQDDDKTLQALDEIETELNSKKYGLVWEKHEEQVDVMMQDNIPVFSEVQEREIKATDENAYNFLLEGDNLHSLKLLEKTHAGKIDVIYIDPPYNTGNNDFIYDDNYIGSDDGYRHSKWISFMNERLKIAKQLLSKQGFIFISIDDNELSQLKILCDEIFDEKKFLSIITVETSLGIFGPKAKHVRKSIIKNKDYLVCYSMNKESIDLNPLYTKSKTLFDTHYTWFKDENTEMPLVEFLKSNDEIVKLAKQVNLEVTISNLNKLMEIFPEVNNIIINNAKNIFRIRDYTLNIPEKYKKEIDSGLKLKINDVFVYKDNNKYLYLHPWEKMINKTDDFKSEVVSSVMVGDLWKGYNDDMGNIGKEGNVKFSNGKKPTRLLKNILKIINNKSATALDFFAGSGTTAHAVLELNKEDGGNRKFILCTNNENNICEEVTYERIKSVINGYADVEGIPANLKYFKTDFVSKDTDDVSSELLEHIKEMVELENGITLDNKHYLIVLTDEEADALAKNWSSYEDVRAIYVSRDVLLTTEQQACFAGAEIHVIPDYYFEYELKEVGEAW